MSDLVRNLEETFSSDEAFYVFVENRHEYQNTLLICYNFIGGLSQENLSDIETRQILLYRQ